MEYTISLKSNRDFRRLYSRGKSAVMSSMVIYCRKNNLGKSRIGFSTGTKLGHAVVRNRVRRRLRAIYRTNELRFVSGYDIIVVARKKAVYSEYSDLEATFLHGAEKLGLLDN